LKALCFSSFGGPEVLEYRDVRDPELREGEVLVRTCAIGLNFADIYRRRGNYHLSGEPPYIAGYEAAGIVAAAAPGTEFKVGERVAFADAPFANAELVAVPEDKLIRLPDNIGFETAAALLLQGLTAHYLVRESHALQAGESALIHAAAGGVGLMLVQMAKLSGARVFGVASNGGKATAARMAGADAVALYADDWIAAAHRFKAGGVDVAYDSVGSTLMDSFRAVRTRGHVVFYGMAGGEPPLVDPRMLMDTSKTLTGGDLWNILTSAYDRRRRAGELFDWVKKGKIKVRIAARYALADGAKAHAFVEDREAIGKVLLIP
jgi:NADPH2:quinone reductase